jgi:hypothetical protein
LAYLVGPTQSGRGLPLARVVAGVTDLNSKTRQERETAPKACKGRMMTDREGQQILEHVRSRLRQAEFLQESF